MASSSPPLLTIIRRLYTICNSLSSFFSALFPLFIQAMPFQTLANLPFRPQRNKKKENNEQGVVTSASSRPSCFQLFASFPGVGARSGEAARRQRPDTTLLCFTLGWTAMGVTSHPGQSSGATAYHVTTFPERRYTPFRWSRDSRTALDWLR